MQINNIVCRISAPFGFIPKDERKKIYRDNVIYFTSIDATIFIKHNIETIFEKVNFAQDLSEHVSNTFEKDFQVTPLIIQLVGSRTFRKRQNTVTDLLRNIDQQCRISRIYLHHTVHDVTPIDLNLLWKRGAIDRMHFQFIIFKAAENKITGKIQGVSGCEIFTTFVLGGFGKAAQHLVEALEEEKDE
jgi:hypothetical protein